jgi:galactokinase
VEHVPFDPAAQGLEVLVIDTRVRHSHADGEYAARRRACEDAAARLGLPSLGVLGASELDRALARLDGDGARRCVRHVVTEDERVRQVVTLLREGRVAETGPQLSASHASLRDDYRVSCPELDLAVATMERSGALGARMTGGGFGGSAIGLLPAADVPAVAARVVAGFADEGLAEPRWFTARPSPGTRPEPGPPTG